MTNDIYRCMSLPLSRLVPGNVSEGSALLQNEFRNLSKAVIKRIDQFFKEGSTQLEDAAVHGYKDRQYLYADVIFGKEWGGKNEVIFTIYPSAKYNPDVSDNSSEPHYISKSGGYFTTVYQGENLGWWGKIVLHLDMYFPLLSDYKPEVVPSSGFDIRDPKIRKIIYKEFKREFYQFAYHESQHAVKRLVHGWEGTRVRKKDVDRGSNTPSLSKKYQKYYDQPASAKGLASYTKLGDEWESILAQISSEIEFEASKRGNKNNLIQILSFSTPSFRRLVVGMLDFDAISQALGEGDITAKKNFKSIWSSNSTGKPRVIIDRFRPFDPDFIKFLKPEYQKTLKSMLKKLVEWWQKKFTKRPVKLQEILDKNAILYLGWVNRNSLKVIGFDIQSGEDETHHNYLMGMPFEWRNEYDSNLVRWRYRKDTNVVYWWEFSKPTDEEKESVELWIKSNLNNSTPQHRIIPSDRNNINFWKSHGEDECVQTENGGSGMMIGGGSHFPQPSHLDIDQYTDTSEPNDVWPFLNEDMTYNDLERVSDPARKQRVGDVNARSLRVRSIDEYEAWTFSYKSNPSNSRTKGGVAPRWQGYIKFIKDDVKSSDDAKDVPCHVDCTCFEGGTLVLMADGRYKPIKDIIVGDEVYTHLGRIRKVIKTGKRKTDLRKESTYSIQVLGFPGKFIATGDHPFYTLRGNDVCLCGCGRNLWDEVSKSDVAKRWSPSMTLGKKFKKGHYRTSKYIKPTDRSGGTFEWIKVKDFRPREWFLSPWMEELTDKVIDPDFARLVGYYAAEGCIPGGRGTEVRLTFNINEIDTLGRDVASICDKLGMKFKTWKPNQKYGNWFNIRIMDKEFRKFCLDNISGKSLTKMFSSEIMKWNNEALKNVFIGSTLGDGWLDPDKGCVKYISSSPDLVYQLSVVLSRLKIRHTISMASKVSNKNSMYQLVVPNGRSSEVVREWLFPYLRDKDKFNSGFPELHCSDHDREEGQLRALRSHEKVNFDGDVYDLTVEEDESFIVHGVSVHNCPDYKYRWAYNNAQQNAGVIGNKSWNKCINRSPRINLGEGLCKHLLALEGFLRTKIHGTSGDKSNLFESEGMYRRFEKFVNENKEFDVIYDRELNENFHTHRDWIIHEGQKRIKVVFENGESLSFELDYRGNFGEKKEVWRKKAASTWKKLATEIHKNIEITEVGNTIETPWYECFLRSLQSKEMSPFKLTKDTNKITFETGKITGYQNAPKVVAGMDPVNFTPRV